jgi:hypothetical protein
MACRRQHTDAKPRYFVALVAPGWPYSLVCLCCTASHALALPCPALPLPYPALPHLPRCPAQRWRRCGWQTGQQAGPGTAGARCTTTQTLGPRRRPEGPAQGGQRTAHSHTCSVCQAGCKRGLGLSLAGLACTKNSTPSQLKPQPIPRPAPTSPGTPSRLSLSAP